MSHAGNWHRTPGKVEKEARAAREIAERMQPAPTREIEFAISDSKLAELHPCATKAKGWHVQATCTCGTARAVDLDAFLTTYLAHAPWPRVMRHMTCDVCGGQPVRLSFHYRGANLHLVEFGTITVRGVGSRE